MRISKVNLNGTNINLNDLDAVQLPNEELQVDDILVYNGSTFVRQPKSSVVQVESGIIEGSQKLAKSGDVYTFVKTNTLNVKPVSLLVSYNQSSHYLTFGVAPLSENQLQADVQLLILSVNTNFDSTNEELRFSNVIKILTLTSTLNEITEYITPYVEDRVFYCVLINNNQNKQICTLNTNILNVNGTVVLDNNQVSVSVIAPENNSGQQALLFTAAHAVDVNLDFVVRIIGNVDDTEVNIYTPRIADGQSSVQIPIRHSGQARTAYIEMVPSSTSDVYRYVLSNNSLAVPAALTQVTLNVIPDQTDPIINFQVPTGYDPDANIDITCTFVQSGHGAITRNCRINSGSGSGQLNYSDIVFNGPVVYAEMAVNADRDSRYQYRLPSDEIITIVDKNGNPW